MRAADDGAEVTAARAARDAAGERLRDARTRAEAARDLESGTAGRVRELGDRHAAAEEDVRGAGERERVASALSARPPRSTADGRRRTARSAVYWRPPGRTARKGGRHGTRPGPPCRAWPGR
ncbi:hypothetical protein NKH18_50400 [Streptomyces sp. M10(2022)]